MTLKVLDFSTPQILVHIRNAQTIVAKVKTNWITATAGRQQLSMLPPPRALKLEMWVLKGLSSLYRARTPHKVKKTTNFPASTVS